MSEIHTLRGQVAGFKNIVQSYEDQAAEQEYELARLDAERAAAEASLQRAIQAEKERAERQAQINDQLRGDMRDIQVKQQNELKKIRQSNNQAIQKLNDKFQKDIDATRQKNANDIKQLRVETKRLIDEHKSAVKRETDKLNNDVKTLSQNIQSIQNKIITDKNEKVNFVIDAFNALDVLLQVHEVDERSPMKHGDTKPLGFGLDQLRDKLNSMRSQMTTNISDNQLDKLFTDVCISLNDFEEKTWTAHSLANEIKAEFSSILAGMEAIIKHTEKNASFRINALVLEKSCLQKEDNTWSEEREEKTEEVDYWLQGEFRKILEKRKVFLEEIKKLDSSNGVHPQLTEKFLKVLQESSIRWETDFNEMRQKARELAVDSNQRIVNAHRIYKKLVLYHQGAEGDIGFEKEDRRSRVHLSCKVGGEDRTFIWGSDPKKPEERLFTISQGEDHEKQYQGIADEELKLLEDSLDLKDNAGNNLKLNKKSSALCGEIKKFRTEGMKEEQVKEAGQLA
jgi:hypothetical protein